MLRKYFYFAVIAVIFGFAVLVKAGDVSYPISELGNCGSEEECKAFCDDSANHLICINWAESQKVFTPQEAKQMKDTERMEKQAEGENVDPVYGPGGCATPAECDAYCGILEHLEECLKYNVENGYMTSEEADAARAERDKKGPGGCSSEEECNSFCNDPDNIEECMNFVVEEGKITREEADFMIEQMKAPENSKEGKREMVKPHPEMVKIDEKKAVEILVDKGGPGGCKTLDECDKYCEDFSHADECLGFVKENQLAPSEEIEKMEKMKEVMAKGGPGGCSTPAECDAFCQNPDHMKECMNFAKENKLMSSEEIEKMEKGMEMMSKLKTRGGPGGCSSEEECDAFCQNPDHMKECMDFSVESGMMTEEEREKMEMIEEKMRRRKENGDNSREMRDYPETGPSEEMMYPNSQMPSKEMAPPNNQMPPEGQMMPPNNQMGGPSGCQSPEECDAYCQKPENAEECSKFSGDTGEPFEGQKPPEGMMPPEGTMPPPEETSPPPEEAPQSLLKQLKNFLADIGILINF